LLRFIHALVQEACAIGIPHQTRGEQIKAFVVLREGQTATEQDIIKQEEMKKMQ
jgi:long-chain acyl-CoA synthetase